MRQRPQAQVTRMPPRLGRRRTRAGGPSTRGTAEPARPSARRSERSACRAGGGAQPCSPRKDPHPDGRRKRNGGAAGGREPHRLDATREIRASGARICAKGVTSRASTRCAAEGPRAPASCCPRQAAGRGRRCRATPPETGSRRSAPAGTARRRSVRVGLGSCPRRDIRRPARRALRGIGRRRFPRESSAAPRAFRQAT